MVVKKDIHDKMSKISEYHLIRNVRLLRFSARIVYDLLSSTYTRERVNLYFNIIFICFGIAS